MPKESRPDSTLMLWLEDALPGWILPVAAIVIVLAVTLLYGMDVIGEQVTGTLVTAAFAGALAWGQLLPAAQLTVTPATRATAIAGGVLSVGIVLYSFQIVAFPGTPAAETTLTMAQKTLTLPEPGTYRLLISGHLAGSGESKGTYRLSVPQGGDVEGALARNMARRTFKRGAGVTVAQEHTQNFHYANVGSPPGIELARLGNELQGELHVAAFKALPFWILALLAGLAVMMTTVSDVLLAAKGRCAVVGGAAACFAVMIATQVSPSSLAKPAFGGAMIGVFAGAVWQAIGIRLVTRLGPASWGKAAKAKGAAKEKRA